MLTATGFFRDPDKRRHDSGILPVSLLSLCVCRMKTDWIRWKPMKHTYHKLNLDCLVILGGNGTQKTANLLREEGLNIDSSAEDHRQ